MSSVRAGEPDEHPREPGAITVYILLEGTAATLSGTVMPEDVDELVDHCAAFAGRFRSLDEARKNARTYIMQSLGAGKHMRAIEGGTIIASALWLACTAPAPQGPDIREKLRAECCLALQLTRYSVHGREAINGRMGLFAPGTDFQTIEAILGSGPSAESVIRKLAPN
jgi:hypothetical protein